MIALRRLPERQRAFVRQFVATGGSGAIAARQAGYALSSAAVVAHRLLRRDMILGLILAEIEAGADGAAAALASLQAPGRASAIRRRVALLRRSATRPRLIRPGAVVHDRDDEVLRTHLLKQETEGSGCKARLHGGAPVDDAPGKSSNSAASEAPHGARSNGSTARRASFRPPQPRRNVS